MQGGARAREPRLLTPPGSQSPLRARLKQMAVDAFEILG